MSGFLWDRQNFKVEPLKLWYISGFTDGLHDNQPLLFNDPESQPALVYLEGFKEGQRQRNGRLDT